MFDAAINLHLRTLTDDRPPRGRRKDDAEHMVGTVKWFDPRKGYGFLGTADGDVYVHISAVERSRRQGFLPDLNLLEGQRLRFDLEPDKYGKRPKATNISLAA